MEERIITGRLNPHIDPVLDIWQWQVPVYLFLGGLTAGLLILGAASILRKETQPAGVLRLQLAVPVILAVGMFALFLDLEVKWHVWRFYTTFEITSPMSWGSWILLLVVPASVLLIGGTLRESWPGMYAWTAARSEAVQRVLEFSERRLTRSAQVSLGLGVALGIYTGILLSAFGARPFWNTAVLGPLFLLSGLSSAAALVQMTSRRAAEQHSYARVDVGLIAAELVLIGLMVFTMATGSLQHQAAAALVLGGALTAYFWVFVILIGLVLPVSVEIAQLKGRRFPRLLAPALILLGGLIFRFFIVEAGQITTWISY
jgi:protein NrfD